VAVSLVYLLEINSIIIFESSQQCDIIHQQLEIVHRFKQKFIIVSSNAPLYARTDIIKLVCMPF